MPEDVQQAFGAARLNHILFKTKLRSFLYGSGTDEASLRDADVCALGQWITTVALPQFGHLPKVHQLDRVHRRVHSEDNVLLNLYKSGQTEQAIEQLPSMLKITDEILQLLNTLERKLRTEER